MFRFHLCRFETWTISFTPLCPCLSEETLKAVGPNSCVSSRLGCLEYNYLRLELLNEFDGNSNINLLTFQLSNHEVVRCTSIGMAMTHKSGTTGDATSTDGYSVGVINYPRRTQHCIRCTLTLCFQVARKDWRSLSGMATVYSTKVCGWCIT